MEEEEKEEIPRQQRSAVSRWLDPVTSLIWTKEEQPKKTYFELTTEEMAKARQEILNQPNTPFFATLIIKGTENTFTVVTALSLASLLTTAYLHNIFHNKLTPHILYYSFILDQFVRKSFYDVQELRKRWKRFSSVNFMRSITYLRRKSPFIYYRLLAIYLKLRNYATIPRRTVRNTLWVFSAIYINMLLFSMYILQKLAPGLEILLRKSWSELYEICEIALRYLATSDVLQELNH
jgi:hypothetical protein